MRKITYRKKEALISEKIYNNLLRRFSLKNYVKRDDGNYECNVPCGLCLRYKNKHFSVQNFSVCTKCPLRIFQRSTLGCFVLLRHATGKSVWTFTLISGREKIVIPPESKKYIRKIYDKLLHLPKVENKQRKEKLT